MPVRDLVAYSSRTMAPDFASLAPMKTGRTTNGRPAALPGKARRAPPRLDELLLLVMELRELPECFLGAAGQGRAAATRGDGQVFEWHRDEMAAEPQKTTDLQD